MKKLALAFLCILLCASLAAAKQAGWVPIPAKPDTNLTKAGKKPKKSASKSKITPGLPVAGATVYDKQPPVTESEIISFVSLLPQFRAWARAQGEEAHPVVSSSGQPDFTYSSKASDWVQSHNFNSRRFFCIMGRLAAGMVIIEEGNDFKGTRPQDMPEISSAELELVRRHLGELLNASRNVPPVKVN